MRTLVANMAIGAALASMKVLLAFPYTLLFGSPGQRLFSVQALFALGAGGAAAGALFTVLAPIRRRAAWGLYLGWVLPVYALLAVVVGVGLWHGDDPDLLREPTTLVFLLGSGFVLGAFCARLQQRWDSEDGLAVLAGSAEYRKSRKRYELASWFFVTLLFMTYVATKGSVNPIPFSIMMVSFAGFVITKAIATSPVSVARTLLALGAVVGGLAAGVWILVAVNLAQTGRATGLWVSLPVLVIYGLVCVGLFISALALVRHQPGPPNKRLKLAARVD